MKKILFSVLFITLILNLNAQFEYDCLDRKDFSIIKENSTKENALKVRASELDSIKTIEQLFGSNFIARKEYAEVFDENFTYVSYADGLTLKIPELEKESVGFNITSDRYIIILSNGRIIKVGMKGDEFKDIFPKSYSRYGQEGNTALRVFFSITRNGKLAIEDSWIVFLLSKEDCVLERIYSVVPN
jgi:hypothetical protein